MEQPVNLHHRSAVASHVIEWVCSVCGNHVATPVTSSTLDAIAASPPRCSCSNLMDPLNREEVRKQIAKATQAEQKESQDRRKTLGIPEKAKPAPAKRKRPVAKKPVGGSKPGVKKPRNGKTQTRAATGTRTKPAQPVHTHAVEIKGVTQ